MYLLLLSLCNFYVKLILFSHFCDKISIIMLLMLKILYTGEIIYAKE